MTDVCGWVDPREYILRRASHMQPTAEEPCRLETAAATRRSISQSESPHLLLREFKDYEYYIQCGLGAHNINIHSCIPLFLCVYLRCMCLPNQVLLVMVADIHHTVHHRAWGLFIMMGFRLFGRKGVFFSRVEKMLPLRLLCTMHVQCI